MILEEMLSLADNNLHNYLDEVRLEHPDAIADPRWSEYAEGKHRPVADLARKVLLGDMKVGDVKENVIGQCVSQIASRVRFKKFLVEAKETNTYLNDVFLVKNQFPKQMLSVTKRAITDGSAAMSVSWKGGRDGRPVIFHEAWWDGDKGMFVGVSHAGDVEWAVSDWYAGDNAKFRTLYLDDKILQFKKDKDGWRVIKTTEWVRPDGRPIGVPIAHFPNGAATRGPYPSSTVAKVIDAQDALNASLFNRQSVSALTGAMIYWGTGIGNSDSIDVGAGKLWTSANPDSRFGAIPPGSLKELLEDTNDLRGVIAGEFPVPSYRLDDGDWPSGLALQRADSPMISYCKLLEEVLDPGAVRLAHRATELYNIFGDGKEQLDEDSIIKGEWDPTDELDPGTEIEINQAKVDLYAALMDLPEPLLKKTGILTDQEITDIMAFRAEEEEKALAEAPPGGGRRGSAF